ncbi:phiSA1p31-related protein [Streptomyces sp. B27]|uniref:phiSA1p31-related protein n=1 Tax=Streptomyces sp. B27 TaxID=2485015 RepID=UPI000FD7AD68|nr:phiSA1p31-related protein [Streptomyces sp. B27]
MTDTPITPDVALARLRQYGERTSTWSTATYNNGTEKALHQIAVSLAGEVDRLRAELEASVCRCFDPSHHNPDCKRAVVVWNGVKYNAASWYRDAEGEWWMACAIDDQGQPLMRVWNDLSNAPVTVSEVESDYGPLYRSDDGPDELRQPEGF